VSVAYSTNDEPSPTALPRLLPPVPLRTFAQHVDYFGPVPPPAGTLVAEVDRSGLKGHGGAGFPTAVKMRAVAGRRGPRVVVANGTEGEPASAKDKTLLSIAPHLVLDGAALTAAAVGARDAIVCVDRSAPEVVEMLRVAVDERMRRRRDATRFRVEAAPHRYVAGEETALVSWLNGNDAKPTFVPPRPFERGVRGRPTLVQNVETLAHVALIARHGAGWFRALGTAAEPGSMLVTCTGGFGRTGVYEVPLGIPLPELLRATGTDLGEVQAVLVGGYFGSWVPAATVRDAHLSSESLRAHGATLGCGVLAALPRASCGLTESARVTRWLADQNAGQCGPCVFGLDSIARAMAALAKGDRTGNAELQLHRWLAMVKGRGACKHPDGTARFVESSLRVFADEIERHRHVGPCRESRSVPLLPTPRTGGWR
jgi:NADH:ubiquinone oxidoreductase subunit F (NADH-binding)